MADHEEENPVVMLEQHESQLKEIEELLETDPTNEEYLQLKKDMLELIELTKQDIAASRGGRSSGVGHDANVSDAVSESYYASSSEQQPALTLSKHHSGGNGISSSSAVNHQDGGLAAAMASLEHPAATTQSAAADAAADGDATKKKKKIKRDLGDSFVVPPHLVILESDNEAAQNRKRRTVKALRRQWNANKKDVERESRQASWQNFAKKSKKRKGVKESSIWSTSAQAGVGIVATNRSDIGRSTDVPKRPKMG